MIIDFIIVGLIWFGGRYVWHIDFSASYQAAFKILTEYDLTILTYGTMGAICLVMISYILRALGFFSLMRIFTKLIFEISQLSICFLSIFAVILLFQINVNLWQDISTLSVIPFEVLIASCVSLYLFDFNYPLGSKILPNIMVPILSILTVFGVIFSGIIN